MSACAYLPARSTISFPGAVPLLSAGIQRHKNPFPCVRRLFPACSRPPGDPPALPEPRDPPGAARQPRPAPRSRPPMGEPLTRRARSRPPMGGAVVGFAGCGSRTLSGGGRSVPEGAAGAAGGGDRDSDSLVRGPAAAAPSLPPVLVCPRVSAAAVTVRRRLKGAASSERAVRG